MTRDVVIVESPAKAKTIEKYLGPDFKVLASYGHVRDLPAKDGSVRPEQDFAMDYEVDARSAKRIREIADAVKGARTLYLATDPDREGEAISWHVLKALESRKVLKDMPVRRVAFSEITKTAVLNAIAHPRDLDMNLVNAQQARRALDYLVGFTLSPVLWRKLPGARSAGRVQSVALRAICEREMEIEAFTAQEYWTIDGRFATPEGQTLTARLVQLDGAKLDKFDIGSTAEADAAMAKLLGRSYRLSDVTKKPARRNPAAPFTTSTLQQEASRKLGFSADRTMRVAQRLYEGIDLGGETVGLISYMRTDGVSMAGEALAQARNVIGRDFGDRYLPPSPRIYKSKQKNAQEAHEAIRPTDFNRHPDRMGRYLDQDQLKLYALVWRRAMASQMAAAEFERTTATIEDETRAHAFRATGSIVTFPGFLKLYEEGRDDISDDPDDARLPPLEAGWPMKTEEIRPEQHFTEPPPRYSEASLVKRLEELGIGRPSTYAAILQVLRERNYVRMDRNRFIPEDKGRIVVAFLTNFFERYFAYDFTAALEEKLDDVSDDRLDWKAVLRDFWRDFSLHEAIPPEGAAPRAGAPGDLQSVQGAVSHIDALLGKRGEIIETIDRVLGPHFFPEREDGRNPRACPACADGGLGIKVGKMGAFIGCTNYPECRYTRPLSVGDGNGEGMAEGPKLLGEDPQTGLPVSLRRGPYGVYVQLGEAENGEKPKRSSLPKGTEPETLTLEQALSLLALPRDVCLYEGEMIQAGIGRFGPYVKHGKTFASLAKDDNVLTIGDNRAIFLIEEKRKRGSARAGGEPLKVLGEHPDGGEVAVMAGKYGPYVKHGKVNATLPKDTQPDALSMSQAIELLTAKAAKSPKKGAAKPKAAKAKSAKTAKTKAAAKPKAAGKTKAAAATARRPARKTAAARDTDAAADTDGSAA
ncbi:MAG: type I DNA topoisomerase [Sneathiellaceae bacterium]